MKKFKMLGKAEMKNVKGGIDPVCFQACIESGGSPSDCAIACANDLVECGPTKVCTDDAHYWCVNGVCQLR